ncbi:MAG TPA: hypothetical protein VF876_00885 [Burkholderiales bacterium]
MRRPLALALALAAPLACAQTPAAQEGKPAAQKAQKAAAPQKAQKASKPRGAQGESKAHAKPTPEQIRRFNELQKQQEQKR